MPAAASAAEAAAAGSAARLRLRLEQQPRLGGAVARGRELGGLLADHVDGHLQARRHALPLELDHVRRLRHLLLLPAQFLRLRRASQPVSKMG